VKKRHTNPPDERNAIVHQERWTTLRPNCHPEAHWRIHHSPMGAVYSFQCAQCGRPSFSVEITNRGTRVV